MEMEYLNFAIIYNHIRIHLLKEQIIILYKNITSTYIYLLPNMVRGIKMIHNFRKVTTVQHFITHSVTPPVNTLLM